MTIYLYVKTHNKTGLKYLGQTSQQDPHSYPGSGTRWIRHLKKHGYDYTTKILKECSNKEELRQWGIYYSDLWNIVSSNMWANLKPEEADGGQLTPEIKEKIRNALIGRIQTDDHRLKNSLAHIGANNIMYGKTHTKEARDKIAAAKIGNSFNVGRIHTDETNQKRRESIKALAKIQCCYCGMLSHPNNHRRWHGDNCKFKI